MTLQEVVETLAGKLTESVAERRRLVESDGYWSNSANAEIVAYAKSLVELLERLWGRNE